MHCIKFCFLSAGFYMVCVDFLQIKQGKKNGKLKQDQYHRGKRFFLETKELLFKSLKNRKYTALISKAELKEDDHFVIGI